MNLKSAKKFARKKHKGQYRRHGAEYIVHPIRTMEILQDKGIEEEKYLITALFHDLIEDTDATKEEIIKFGDLEIYEAVKVLSKEDGYVMKEYVEGISKNELTKLVKLADRISNLEDAHCTEDIDFMEHYIEETKEWYIPLSEGTIFEKDMNEKYEELVDYYNIYTNESRGEDER